MKKLFTIISLTLTLIFSLASCDSLLSSLTSPDSDTQLPNNTVGDNNTNNDATNGGTTEDKTEGGDTTDSSTDDTDTVPDDDVVMDYLPEEIPEGFSSDGLIFSLSEDETYYIVTGYSAPEDDGVSAVSGGNAKHEPGHVHIPDTHEGLPVKEIGDEAFKGHKGLKRVHIKANRKFKRIGAGAFRDCENLEDVDIPYEVYLELAIADDAFDGCDNIKQITEYKNGIYLEFFDNPYYVLHDFVDCTVTEFVVHEDVQSIHLLDKLENLVYNEYEGFYYLGTENNPYFALIKPTDSAPENYKLHKETELIGPNAFSGCTFSSLVLPENVTHISREAFSASAITDVTFPKSLESYQSSIFQNHDNPYQTFTVRIDSIEHWLDITRDGQFNFSAYYENIPSYCNLYIDGKLVTEIVVPEGVTEICDYAFAGFNITKVTLPSSVEYIGDAAFSDMSITEIRLPRILKYIGNEAFSGNTIEKVVLPDEVIYVGEKAFENTTVSELVLNKKLYYIGDYAFSGTNIKSIVIPGCVKYIGAYAFYGCYELTDVTLQEGVEYVGDYAFTRTNLTNVILADSLKQIGFLPFYPQFAEVVSETSTVFTWGNVKFNEYENGYYIGSKNNPYMIFAQAIDRGVQSVTFHAKTKFVFGTGYMPNIKELSLPEGIKGISGAGFNGCENCEVINLPSSLEYIAADPSENISSSAIRTNSLKSINVAEGNIFYKSIDGVLYTKDGKKLIVYPVKKDGESFVIPDSVETLQKRAFSGNAIIKSIVLSERIVDVPAYTFYRCTNLKQIELGSVKSIGRSAFNGCSALVKITLPDSLEKIESSAFWGCSRLTELTIPENVTYIESSALFGCSNLLVITNRSKHFDIKTKVYLSNILYKIENLHGETTYRYSDHTSVEIFDTDDGFRFLDINDGEEYILVAYLGEEKTITLPIDVNGKEYRFMLRAYPGVENIIIPEGITKVAPSIFTLNIKSFTIPASVTRISIPSKFSDSITSVTIDENNEYYTIIDGNIYTKDGKTLVKQLSNRDDTAITVPNGVTDIGSYAFSDCYALEEIIIPSSITSINKGAFRGCTALSSVYYAGTEEEWTALGLSADNINNATVHYNYTTEE